MSMSLVTRGIYDENPPSPRTALQNNATLLVCWWCTATSFTIILIRTVGRYKRTERFFLEDKVMMIGIIPLLARMSLVHLVLIWGTNNAITEGLSETEIRNREIGSRLVLLARICYAVYIWLAKYTVCEFLRRLTGMIWTKTFQVALRAIEYFLATTLAAVIVATLAECHPFNHYWQVVPDPGPHCRLGYANLLTMGVCDILTDIFLVVLPVSLFLASAMTIKRKIQLTLLFASSLILVAITGYRVPSVIKRDGLQPFRSLVASFEILAATAVSNFVVIGSFLRDRGLKRVKYRREDGSVSVSDSVDHASVRRATITKHHWGSDADLASGLGFSLDPELQANQGGVVRPAPVFAGLTGSRDDRSQSVSRQSDSRSTVDHTMTGSSTTSKPYMALLPPSFADINDPGLSSNTRRHSLSFYDVGGLLECSERQQLQTMPIGLTRQQTGLQESSATELPFSSSSSSSRPEMQHSAKSNIEFRMPLYAAAFHDQHHALPRHDDSAPGSPFQYVDDYARRSRTASNSTSTTWRSEKENDTRGH